MHTLKRSTQRIIISDNFANYTIAAYNTHHSILDLSADVMLAVVVFATLATSLFPLSNSDLLFLQKCIKFNTSMHCCHRHNRHIRYAYWFPRGHIELESSNWIDRICPSAAKQKEKIIFDCDVCHRTSVHNFQLISWTNQQPATATPVTLEKPVNDNDKQKKVFGGFCFFCYLFVCRFCQSTKNPLTFTLLVLQKFHFLGFSSSYYFWCRCLFRGAMPQRNMLYNSNAFDDSAFGRIYSPCFVTAAAVATAVAISHCKHAQHAHT